MRIIPLLVLSFLLSLGSAHGATISLVVWGDNGATPFAGDTASVVTVSPNGDGFRDTVIVHYRLSSSAAVRIDAVSHSAATRELASPLVADAGEHVLHWTPPSYPVPAAYVIRVVADRTARSVVVHVQGVDAAIGSASYRPGETARLAVATDAHGLRVDVLRLPAGPPRIRRNDKVQGTPVGRSFHVTWSGRRDRPHALAVPLESNWRSGIYFVRLVADDGRAGFAPLVLRPRRLGATRVAVVMPTNTWQAYDFYDRDGDGRGDTWYAGWRRDTTRLGRPYLDRGVPAHFNHYELPFLRWAARRHLHADYLSDADLASVASGDALARLYDFVVFPSHHEYVTQHEYDVVRRYRDLGGNLAWLSADNFFWKVVRHGPILERVAQWRTIGRPEAALTGVQYRGNDEGQHQEPMVVAETDAAPWFYAHTGLHPGSRFGRFGIEVDARTAASPAGTTVLASIPEIFGPGVDAEMTYYKQPNGAKVFAAGAFSLAGLADSHLVAQLLDNLFDHLEQP